MAARVLESLGEDELAGVVASHYLEAYRSSPDDAEHVWSSDGASRARSSPRGDERSLSGRRTRRSSSLSNPSRSRLRGSSVPRSRIREPSRGDRGEAPTSRFFEHFDRAIEEYTVHGEKERAAHAFSRSLRVARPLTRSTRTSRG